MLDRGHIRIGRTRQFLGIWLLLALIPCPNAAGAKSPEENKQEDIRKASRRLAGLPPSGDADSIFIRARARELLERSQHAPAGSYTLEQLMEAFDDAMDAVEELSAALRRDVSGSARNADRTDTARRLERTYFRVAQAEYFAKISQDPHGQDYVRLAGRMYQAARREYDSQDYERSRRFAEVAQEIVSTIENLAHAALPVREPPSLEK